MSSFVLAVDHRQSLREWLRSIGVESERTEPTARKLKVLCAHALAAAAPALHEADTPMLLVDEQYGVDAIAVARGHDLAFMIAAERSGRPEFEFEHGSGFGEAIASVDPYAVKALVRYNPCGDGEARGRSRRRLRQLQDYLESTGRRFMLELLVLPTTEQASRYAVHYDEDARPTLTVAAIDQLAADGLHPDWWKLEGNREQKAAAQVAQAARAACKVGCLVLGRGQDREAVDRWLTTAAALPGYDGFAVGRTLWAAPFEALVRGLIDETETTTQITTAYLDLVATYRLAKQHTERGEHDYQNPNTDEKAARAR